MSLRYGIERTSHGNYVCPFCKKRKVMKSVNGIFRHVESEHALECETWVANDKARESEARAENAERKLKLYIEETTQKPKQEYYDATVFCTTCHHLNSCGMPKGVLPGNVTCPNCGINTLHLVDNVYKWWSK